MVLSNKKLKKKLREKLAESLISSVAGKDSNGDVSGEPDTESRRKSLKELLGTVCRHGPRLSKREKRRESLILTASDGNKDEKKEDGNRGLGETKREKKRKRDEGAKEKNLVDGLEENNEKAKKLKKKKKQQKKKKKKSNKKAKNGEEEEEKQGEVSGNEVKVQVEETHYNIGSEFNENLATKVYVGGIPYYSTEDDICCFFESCGTITEIDCMKFPESGKFRGIAILTFKTEAAAKRALAWDGADMGGLFLKVQPYKGTRTNRAVDFSPAIVEGYNRIYLGNLSWDVTEDDLKKLFANCKIASIRFGMDKETGEFRGYAHVDFSDNVSLKTALKLDQNIIHGRPVKIRCAVPKKGTERRGGEAAAAAAVAETHLEMHPDPMPETKEAAETTVVSSVSGKIRRRTCYECGEKGHLSSHCPKKQLVDSVAS
ncbi:protein gar2 [Benincasa hispida]|uniref:protein gar2 n=1 Tax=Benincasa hispida TaxID=102211 RepID=UPI0018FFAF96|nr:protein gar2 [Benincasa hispida]